MFFFFFSSRRRHTRCGRDWSSDVCSSDLWASPDLPGEFDRQAVVSYKWKATSAVMQSPPSAPQARDLTPQLRGAAAQRPLEPRALTEDPTGDPPRYAWRGVRPIHSSRRWASFVGPLRAKSWAHSGQNRGPTPGKIVEGGRCSRPCGPGAHSRASEKIRLRLRHPSHISALQNMQMTNSALLN